jgi:hypothetical protein
MVVEHRVRGFKRLPVDVKKRERAVWIRQREPEIVLDQLICIELEELIETVQHGEPRG